MIPTFQDCMLPTLKLLADRKDHSANELYNYVTSLFQMTEEEKNTLLPSKRITRIRCNLSWARTYLKKAGLISSKSRATYAITNEGVKLLATNPSFVNMKTLEHYDSYNLWQTMGKQENGEAQTNSKDNNCETELTPDETIGRAYEELRSILAKDLLDKILEQSPYFFEKLVVRLLVAMGYGGSFNEITEMMVGKTGDEGIDGVIKEDRLGLDNIYVQAKRWDKTKTVGRPDIQQFVGALAGRGVNKGIYITTAHFSEQAKNFKPQNNIKVALIDGDALCQYMIDYNIGVAIKDVYEVKRIDLDFFSDDE